MIPVKSDSGIRYIDTGIGTPVLFLHGFSMTPLLFSDFFRRMEGYRFIAPFLSEGLWVKQKTAEDFLKTADVLPGFLDRIGIGEPLSVIGFSMGGRLTWELARRHPNRVKSAAIFDGSLFPMPMGLWPAYFTLNWEIVRSLFSRQAGPMMKICRDSYTNLSHRPLSLYRQAKALQGASPVDPEKWGHPLLAVWGKDDPVYPEKTARKIFGRIKNCRYEVVEGRHSVFPLDQAKAALMVKSFLNGHQG